MSGHGFEEGRDVGAVSVSGSGNAINIQLRFGLLPQRATLWDLMWYNWFLSNSGAFAVDPWDHMSVGSWAI